MRKMLMLGLAATTIVVAAGCQGDQLTDAPVGIIDDSPTFVITNADRFPNLALRCYEGALIITTTRDYGDAVNVFPEFAGSADGDPVPDGEGG